MKALFALVLLAACSKPNDVPMLQEDAAAIHAYYQPQLDALAKRVDALRGHAKNLPGSQAAMDAMNNATSMLGVPVFESNAVATPGYKPSPTSAFAIWSNIKPLVDKAAADGNAEELERLVEKEREAYELAIAKINENLLEAESWLGSVGQKPVPPPPAGAETPPTTP